MSTPVHLPGEDIGGALAELRRVIRPGGLLEVGLWGADADGEWTDAQGRYFRQRTDARVKELLSDVGDPVDFRTWEPLPGGAHYQWSRLLVSRS